MQTIVLNQDDLVTAYRLNYLQLLIRTNSKKNRRVTVIFYVVLFLLVWFQGFPMAGIVALLVPLIFLVLIIFVWFVSLPNAAKKQIKSPTLSMPYDIHWDEDYLYNSSRDMEGKLSWHVFSKIVENDRCILLYSQNCLFHIYPKRFFNDDSELHDFKAHAQKGIDEHHLKNSSS
ncbi:MAG: YcxB family protein [Wohlfahrtiimonas sp.]